MNVGSPRTIGLTRPDGANDGLSTALSTLLPDARLINWPLLTFAPIPEQQKARAAIAQITTGDWAIFVSPRAVRFAHELHDLTTLPAIHWAAVGETTTAAIQSLFSDPPRVHHPSTTQDSEGLLANLPIEAMREHTVWLFRGETGRETLADTLRQNGITVIPVPVYQRSCAPTPDALLAPPTTWVITSPESLRCLRQLADTVEAAEERRRLLHCNLVVINARTEARARALGFTGAIVRAEAPDDAALARACAVFKQD
ncbi:uroporphyrinogen-III synthase [Halothiobacillus sp.]|uniref:uroporphyrinogen-III synthase n=1 Tax=Halothiobacillus sp. TaxID=1891311 RepID=UPI002624D33F|nr:uroporphyrinogen-III synthase [Halothiobacillus sp.]MDD4966677.1 uroporphyrinogen-III synthase [Halothiobacillus sp.]